MDTKQVNRVLGIDPGTARVGWAVVDVCPGAYGRALSGEVIKCGVWADFLKVKRPTIELFVSIRMLIREYDVKAACVEKPRAAGKGALELVECALCAGECIQFCRNLVGWERTLECTSMEWRSFVVGRPNANDADVRAALNAIGVLPKKSSPDSRDAIGIAMWGGCWDSPPEPLDEGDKCDEDDKDKDDYE